MCVYACVSGSRQGARWLKAGLGGCSGGCSGSGTPSPRSLALGLGLGLLRRRGALGGVGAEDGLVLPLAVRDDRAQEQRDHRHQVQVPLRAQDLVQVHLRQELRHLETEAGTGRSVYRTAIVHYLLSSTAMYYYLEPFTIVYTQ